VKKLTVITFGLMGIIFGLVFSSTKIHADVNQNPTYIYWSQYDGDTISILAPELPNSNAGRLSFFDFIESWDNYYDTVITKNALITIQSVYIDFNITTYQSIYKGYIDQINIYTNKTTNYIYITFYFQGSLKYTFERTQYDLIQGSFIIENSVQDEFGDIRYDSGYRLGYQGGRTVGLEEGQMGSEELYNRAYQIGYEEAKQYYYEKGYNEGYELISEVEFEKGFQQGLNDGYNNGYQDGIDAVYYDGFGGFINPSTGNPYDENYSYPYGKGYNNGLQSDKDYSFMGILFQVFGGLGALLTIELLPNITIGAIVAVPLVFGIIYFILGKRGGE